MMELTINGKVYSFHFGFGFLKEINRTISVPLDGVPDAKRNLGLRYKVGALIDGDVEELVEVLDAANKGCEPRVTRAELVDYIEDENTDIDKLFDTVMDFLSKANCTRKTARAVLDAVEEEKRKTKERNETPAEN
ncbi:MAG: tail assembly chaperone [Butyricicoccus sp.]